MKKLLVISIAFLLTMSSSTFPSINSSASSKGITVAGTLPKKIYYSTAVWDGDMIYLFGGQNPDGSSAAIFSFDPQSNQVNELNVTLPNKIKRHAAVWTGTEVFIFGGEINFGEPIADIVRFVPPDTIELLENALPHSVMGGSAVWSGIYIYHFGNCICPEENVKKIVRFDPITNQSVVLEEELCGPLSGTSAVWYNGSAYIFGGRTGVGEVGITDEIVKFTPGEGCRVMDAKLSSPRFRTSAVVHDGYAYVFGGYGPSGFLDDIVRYDFERDESESISTRLPSARAVRTAVSAGNYSYILGGESETEYLDEILQFDPNFKEDIDPGEPFWIFGLLLIAVIMIFIGWLVGRRRAG